MNRGLDQLRIRWLSTIRGVVMSHEGSVTKLIGRVQQGNDDDAFGELFRLYFRRLVGLARRRLAGIPDPEADEEDAAMAAMASFCKRVAAGKLDQLTDRNSLWDLLATMTARKAFQQIKRRTRAKRDVRRGGRLIDDAGVAGEEVLPDELFCHEPTPEEAAMFAENWQRLFELLEDATLQQVARWTLEGFSTSEIAKKLGRNKRTVERKLESIREIWKEELER